MVFAGTFIGQNAGSGGVKETAFVAEENPSVESLYSIMSLMSGSSATESVQQGITLTVDGKNTGIYDYYINDGGTPAFDSSTWYTTDSGQHSIVVFKADTTLPAVNISPGSNKYSCMIFCNGNLNLNGCTINMNARYSGEHNNLSDALRITSGFVTSDSNAAQNGGNTGSINAWGGNRKGTSLGGAGGVFCGGQGAGWDKGMSRGGYSDNGRYESYNIGKGGRGAGSVFIIATGNISGAATINCNGENGQYLGLGGASGSGYGAGGGGGAIFMFCGGSDTSTGTRSVSGGSGGGTTGSYGPANFSYGGAAGGGKGNASSYSGQSFP